LVRVILVSAKVARTLVTQAAAVVKVVTASAHITEVGGSSAVESTPVLVLKSSNLRHRRADATSASGLLEDVDRTLVGLALRRVTKTHMMRKSVHDAALRWRQGRREDDKVAAGVLLEQEKTGVVLQSLRVVKVDIRFDLWLRLCLLTTIGVEERSGRLHATSGDRRGRVARNARVER
jgi:hypothetical protein